MFWWRLRIDILGIYIVMEFKGRVLFLLLRWVFNDFYPFCLVYVISVYISVLHFSLLFFPVPDFRSITFPHIAFPIYFVSPYRIPLSYHHPSPSLFPLAITLIIPAPSIPSPSPKSRLPNRLPKNPPTLKKRLLLASEQGLRRPCKWMVWIFWRTTFGKCTAFGNRTLGKKVSPCPLSLDPSSFIPFLSLRRGNEVACHCLYGIKDFPPHSPHSPSSHLSCPVKPPQFLTDI